MTARERCTTALVVIDMQNSYFELPGLKEYRDGLIEQINPLIHAAHEAGQLVVLVRTMHERDRSTWTLNMHEDDQGFAFPDTDQSEFVDGLDQRDHIDLIKTRDSAFFGTDLVEQLQGRGVTHLLLCGVSTHSCIAQTATDAFAHNLHAAVSLDAIASDNSELSDALLSFLHSEMRQPLLHEAESLALLREGWPRD